MSRKTDRTILVTTVVIVLVIVLAKLWPRDVQFCLVTSRLDQRAMVRGELNLDQLVFDPDPVFAKSDFVAFDLDGGGFWVTAAAARRFASRLSSNSTVTMDGKKYTTLAGLRDCAFVCVVDGEPSYWGVFTSDISSTLYNGTSIRGPLTLLPHGSHRIVRFTIEHLHEPGRFRDLTAVNR